MSSSQSSSARRHPQRVLSLPLALLAAALGGGCADYFAPDVGERLPEPCRNIDSDPDRPVRFETDILPIFEASCRKCHDPNGENPNGYRRSGLSLVTYDELFRGGINSLQRIVIFDQPCQSVLYEKIVDGPPFGKRMPSNGPPFLSDAEIALIHDWIAEGARD